MWYYWLRTSNSWRWLKQADKYLCRFGYRWFPCPTGFIAGLDRVLLCYSVKKISFITNQMYRGYVKNVLYTYRNDCVSDCSFITCGMFFVDGGATGCLQHVNVSRNVICLGANNTNKLLIWFEAYTDWRRASRVEEAYQFLKFCLSGEGGEGKRIRFRSRCTAAESEILESGMT
jgi:hypothetical protein